MKLNARFEFHAVGASRNTMQGSAAASPGQQVRSTLISPQSKPKHDFEFARCSGVGDTERSAYAEPAVGGVALSTTIPVAPAAGGVGVASTEPVG